MRSCGNQHAAACFCAAVLCTVLLVTHSSVVLLPVLGLVLQASFTASPRGALRSSWTSRWQQRRCVCFFLPSRHTSHRGTLLQGGGGRCSPPASPRDPLLARWRPPACIHSALHCSLPHTGADFKLPQALQRRGSLHRGHHGSSSARRRHGHAGGAAPPNQGAGILRQAVRRWAGGCECACGFACSWQGDPLLVPQRCALAALLPQRVPPFAAAFHAARGRRRSARR